MAKIDIMEAKTGVPVSKNTKHFDMALVTAQIQMDMNYLLKVGKQELIFQKIDLLEARTGLPVSKNSKHFDIASTQCYGVFSGIFKC